jgi:hypothetical protein
MGRLTGLVLFVVEELILVQDELPLVELVRVQTLLAHLALPLVGL